MSGFCSDMDFKAAGLYVSLMALSYTFVENFYLFNGLIIVNSLITHFTNTKQTLITLINPIIIVISVCVGPPIEELCMWVLELYIGKGMIPIIFGVIHIPNYIVTKNIWFLSRQVISTYFMSLLICVHPLPIRVLMHAYFNGMCFLTIKLTRYESTDKQKIYYIRDLCPKNAK